MGWRGRRRRGNGVEGQAQREVSSAAHRNTVRRRPRNPCGPKTFTGPVLAEAVSARPREDSSPGSPNTWSPWRCDTRTAASLPPVSPARRPARCA